MKIFRYGIASFLLLIATAAQYFIVSLRGINTTISMVIALGLALGALLVWWGTKKLTPFDIAGLVLAFVTIILVLAAALFFLGLSRLSF